MSTELRLRNDDLAWRTVDDEMIAIDVRDSTYLTANDSGALLWEALAAGATREALAGSLVAACTASTPRRLPPTSSGS